MLVRCVLASSLVLSCLSATPVTAAEPVASAISSETYQKPRCICWMPGISRSMSPQATLPG